MQRWIVTANIQQKATDWRCWSLLPACDVRHWKTHKAFQVSVCINRFSKQSCLIGQYGAHAAIKYSVQHRSHSGLEGSHRSPIYHSWRPELAWKFLQIPCEKLSSTCKSYPEVWQKIWNTDSQHQTISPTYWKSTCTMTTHLSLLQPVPKYLV